MRRAAKADANQPEIIAALRKAGASVQALHTVGQGCPDIVVGFRGVNWLLEIKDGSLAHSRRVLTSSELSWHRAWEGQVRTVCTPADALAAIGALL